MSIHVTYNYIMVRHEQPTAAWAWNTSVSDFFLHANQEENMEGVLNKQAESCENSPLLSRPRVL